MRRGVVILLFSTYSYGLDFSFRLLDLLPHPLRMIVFKCIMRKIGTGCMIDYKTYFRYPSRIEIGNYVAINRGCNFYAVQPDEGTITIGHNVAIGPQVTIFAGGHDYRALDLPVTAARVVIEDNVWIGGNTTILQGVTIGKGSVVGAGSVVSRSVPPFSVVAGNPARVVKQRTVQ